VLATVSPSARLRSDVSAADSRREAGVPPVSAAGRTACGAAPAQTWAGTGAPKQVPAPEAEQEAIPIRKAVGVDAAGAPLGHLAAARSTMEMLNALARRGWACGRKGSSGSGRRMLGTGEERVARGPGWAALLSQGTPASFRPAVAAGSYGQQQAPARLSLVEEPEACDGGVELSRIRGA
jgi:hypothetical protein